MKATIVTIGSVAGALVAVSAAYVQLVPHEAHIVTHGAMDERVEPVEEEVELV